MLSSPQRRDIPTRMNKTTTKKPSEPRNNLRKKRAMSALESKKLSDAGGRVDRKLHAALERKENIVTAKAKKAAGKMSQSSERRQAALKQKEAMVKRKKAQSQSRFDSAKSRRDQMRQQEKEKRDASATKEINTSQTIEDGDKESTSPLQEKLEQKMKAANERKNNLLAAKASKAAEYVSSTSERGLEVLKQKETTGLKLKNESEEKMESAAKRKAYLEQENAKKNEARQKRREYALEVTKQKTLDHEVTAKTESKPRLPVVGENEIVNNNDIPQVIYLTRNIDEEDEHRYLTQNETEESYFNKKIAARNQLAEEIRLANQVKKRELFKISEERREKERSQNPIQEMQKSKLVINTDEPGRVETIGSIDSHELSFDEEHISISGMSKPKENPKIGRLNSPTSLAELDLKLTDLQIMQSIILAEEASMNGESEFRTCDKSISELSNVKVSLDSSEGKIKKKKSRKFLMFQQK